MNTSEKTSMCLYLQDTNVLKGVALIFLLTHHLFYEGNMPIDGINIHDHSLVQSVGIWCKLCVAIFVFLSGYGLTTRAEKNGGIGLLCASIKNAILN